jgi:hypothetical protein
MATRIRTLNFLPEIFQTPTNTQFLSATLDQIVDQPNTMRIEGYIGSKFGYGVNAKNKYVVEPTKTRTDYQLDPGVVFLKNNTDTAKDFISYPGIIDGLALEGGVTTDNSRLWNSQFYSWDSFTDLDKIINFHQYYWIPTGPAAVTVTAETIYSTANFNVTDLPIGYSIAIDGQGSGATNPALTLLRGGVYTFTVDQETRFWIQGAPGVTGYDPQQPNIQTRDVYGVYDNGAIQGVVTFTVPQKTDQDMYNFPGNNQVGVVCTVPFDQIDGKHLSEIGNIDGVTALDGLTVMFYDTDALDQFYTISYSGSPSDPVISLSPAGDIPTTENIYPQYGTEWIGRTFYRNQNGEIALVPYISAPLDILYYQDGSSSDKVGTIRLIESNITNRIDVETDILGKKTYTSPNGISFTNGLKVIFQGDIYPSAYENNEYYVQGVGTAIELIPVTEMIPSESFTSAVYSPYDILPYDIGTYDGTVYVPTSADYITIARNSIDRNAWSRSNRWFHIDVINATAEYNNAPELLTLYTSPDFRAKRPIIEFYPNIRLFDSGILGKSMIDYIDFRTTDAFSEVAGQQTYYPDVQTYTGYTATIDANTNSSRKYTIVTIPADSVSGTFKVGQYIADSTNLLPNNTQITSITQTGSTIVLTVGWEGAYVFGQGNTASIVSSEAQLDQYAIYDGCRIVFASDNDPNVRNKIYIARFSTVTDSDTPVITLTEADDGQVLPDEQVPVLRGYNSAGKDYWYYFNDDPSVLKLEWQLAQTKTRVNQPPLFDVFDSNGISFGNSNVYTGTSFKGNKLFAYGIGAGAIDPVLGFPLRYSSVSNIGDISFDVSLNVDTFNYVKNSTPNTQKVNTGYVYNYSDLTTYARALGWQTAIGESFQYQVFEFNYVASAPVSTYVCDIEKLPNDATPWQTIQVYVNNVLQDSGSYTVTTGPNTTIVNFTVPDPLVDTVVQILLMSDQVSATAYYQVPINLNNNPLNQDILSLNIGDIRGQYQSIYYNAPNTIGPVFGANNYRDLGNLVPYGTTIVQNSASLVLPGTFLRNQNHNLFNALMFNSKEYINYKKLLINTVDNTEFNAYQTAEYMLNEVMDQIASNKNDGDSFFWSDMVPAKAPYASNSYYFANGMDTTIFPLTQIYDFDKANYNGVLVYVSRIIQGVTKQIQLIKNTDYVVSTDSKSLTVTFDLIAGDTVIINEYNQTYGSFVPNTPTKLGLYPATVPSVTLDSDYLSPTYFIVGHDGSYNKLYGNYNPETKQLQDYRDQVLFEFEKRIFNNLKVGAAIPLTEYEVLPGFFRDTDYSYTDILEIYSQTFLDWVGQNRIDFKSQYYDATNQYTYNYNQSGNKINQTPFLQGYWRGIYQYFYDTSNPDTKPWEMLGFANQPTWWETRYGPSPYTSDNLVLWGDLAAGLNWNDGAPYVMPEFIRNDLLKVIPVDSNGDLLSPFVSVMGNYFSQTFNKDWKVGDVGPAEFSYRRSSSWPFDLMRILALTKPAKFFNLGVDLDNYRYNAEFNQYLVNDRTHLVINDVEIYGNGIAKTSYINWIVDFEKQVGVDATTNITSLLDNLDVRLVYRLAGFSDKTMLKFYVEKGSANSTNSSLLIPDESYQVLLYDNQPFDRISYSGVIVQLTSNGYYKVYGNSQTNAYFKIATPKINGNYDTIELYDLSVQVANEYDLDKTILVPYGTEFYTAQELAQFLESYGRYLEYQGVLFDQIQSGLEVTWNQMITEFLYWAQSGWEPGSIINISPAASMISINKDSYIVQPLTLQQQNFILNQNLYPISLVDMSINRDGTLFTAQPLNEGDTVAYGQFNISNFEHGIVFNNTTLFNDIIYNLVTGLRQNRIAVRGSKSAEWDGTVTAQGFILNQDNVQEWTKEIKYTKGSIVKYKNKYWTATRIIQAKEVFDEADWKQTDYNEIQKGLLPNTSTRSYESTIYYDVNKVNLESDADLLSFSLIGYRPRDYLALVDLTDITQVNVYKNLIKNKGTKNAVSAFKGANLPQGGIDYDVYENWAIKAGEFGGVLNSNYVDLRLNEAQLTGNPAILGLTDGIWTTGVQQEVPLYSIYNYGRPISSPDVLPTIPSTNSTQLFATAGYVNVNDIKIAAYYYSRLSSSSVPLSQLLIGDYVWIADLRGTWQVMAPTVVSSINLVTNNSDGTAVVTFDTVHSLKQYDQLMIINFDDTINGYYTVSSVVNTRSVVIVASLNPNVKTVTGNGVGLTLQSQRLSKPSDINSLSLINKEFAQTKVWIDTDTNGDWGVYKKSLNYEYNTEFSKVNSESYGSAVAHTAALGYLVGDANKGEVYRYQLNLFNGGYDISQTFTGGTSFGAAISYADDLFVISKPNGATANDRKVSIYQLVATTLVNELVLYQDPIVAPGSSSLNWGASTAISGDKNWLFISDADNNQVYVYERSPVTGKYQYSTIITVSGLQSTDKFGQSIATDFYGTKIIIGAPNQDFNDSKQNCGYSYVFDRVYQSIEVQYTSQLNVPQSFSTPFAPALTPMLITATTAGTNVLTTSDTSSLTFGEPIVFSANVIGGISSNKVYYVNNITSTEFTIAVDKVTTTASSSNGTFNTIRVENNSSLLSGAPVVFYGNSGTSNIVTGTVYYVKHIDVDAIGAPIITISETVDGSIFELNNATLSLTLISLLDTVPLETSEGSMTAVPQLKLVYVSDNGNQLSDNEYAFVNNTLYVYKALTAGDILSINSNTIALAQTLTAQDIPQVGAQFGTSIDITKYATEVIIGTPFNVSQLLGEGAVYRYTNSGAKFGYFTGTTDCAVTENGNLFINGYSITIASGSDANAVATLINNANIPNVMASAASNKLTIKLIDATLATSYEKLNVSTLDSGLMSQLGLVTYTQTQVINNPHVDGTSQFGYKVKFNDIGSFAVGAPVGTRYESTTFDFTDDENYTNDTLFDNNTTQWIDTVANAGAVYMFDYIENYNASLDNLGQFIYAQSTNSKNLIIGDQPRFGEVLDFNNNAVIVGAPSFNVGAQHGQAVLYTNASGKQDWSIYRESAPVVDINKIQDVQIYGAISNQTLENLDYFDPLQGKLLGAVRQNIDVISDADPANYNSSYSTNSGSTQWGSEQVGQIWLDTSTFKIINYHQNDVTYNSKYWGRVFPGSDVTAYTWVESNQTPTAYVGPGTPYNIDEYTTQYIPNTTGGVTPVYYFWVRNTNTVYSKMGKTLSDYSIQSYIANPQSSGITYLAPLQSNVFALYNCGAAITEQDSVLHIGFATGNNDDVSHSSYELIRANYPDDFLPGLPPAGSYTTLPYSLYNKLIESLSGTDSSGNTVPDPYLPKPVQSGILVRPRQSFFYDRLTALQNYLGYVNNVIAQIPITETANYSFLFAKSPAEIDPVTGEVIFPEGYFYDTAKYWSYVNWWATGYNNSTKSSIQVQQYSDLATLTVPYGTIVTVVANGAGKSETYIYNSTESWVRIGLTNGTIEFSSYLWDYITPRFGFGDNFFDTTPYDTYPSEETKYVIRAINEELFLEMPIYRNKALILMFEYIQAETLENQNYLPWLNKTSFIDVAHTIRELLPLTVFQSDNQDFLAGYINEVKPYHVVVKDFLFKYTGTDVWQGNVTDFDLPAQYDSNIETFVTPELVYQTTDTDNQYLPTDSIWQSSEYNQWYQNYGLSLTGATNYNIAMLNSYVTLVSTSIEVNNIYGFPATGTILIGTELIGYSEVDITTSSLLGLTRGVNGTDVTTHFPGASIYIDLPGVVLLDSGRGYTSTPIITAYIDTSVYPAPRREARLEAVMAFDKILYINVIDPGAGYAVQPKIAIEPSMTITFDSTNVNTVTNSISLGDVVQTGDLVKYVVGSNSTAIGGLTSGEYYYVGVLSNSPRFIVALYTNYTDAVNDTHRVIFDTTGTGSTQQFELSARATAVVSSTPIRENKISIKFDRTSYTSTLSDWTPNTFYGSGFAEFYDNQPIASSSSLSLFSESPNIFGVKASGQGAQFEILDIRNDSTISWSSLTRNISELDSASDVITLNPDSDTLNASGSTVGFYIGMPVNFSGSTVEPIVSGTTYYVTEILSNTEFKINLTLTNSASELSDLFMYTGSTVNQGVISIDYPGISEATATNSTNNAVTIPMTLTGLNGTPGLYSGAAVYFTGDVFGGIVENQIYYIETILDKQTITLTNTAKQLTLNISSTSSTGNVITTGNNQILDNVAVNDAVVFNDMIVNAGSFVIGQEYTIVKLGSTNWNTVAGTSGIIYVVGDKLIAAAAGTGNGTASATTFGNIIAGTVYYVSSILSSTRFTISTQFNAGPGNLALADCVGSCDMENQKDVVKLETDTGSMTMNVGLPVSPGQINGYKFTFYQTSIQYPNKTATPDTANPAEFDVSSILGGYRVIISNKGLSYAVDDVLTIPGDEIGGSTPANDLVLTVSAVDDFGQILSVIVSGTPNQIVRDYYLKVISSSECQVYSDPTLQLPVSGDELMAVFKGVVSTTAIQTTSPNIVVLSDSTQFNVNDPVVFTGQVFGGIKLGEVYYITSKPVTNGVTVSETIGGTPYSLTSAVGSMDIAKAGDFAFLSNPFYFTPSMVKFNNQVYECIISNNDSEFSFGKWILVDSGDTRLNALDRINGYYHPTVNMPGLDLTQLLDGITYPNSTYLGNAFAPDDQFNIDTYLADRIFTDTTPTAYDVQGAPFTYGYGPEEMVPGVITDNLVMIVNTRPGTTWSADEYEHVGYNVKSIEVISTNEAQTEYSFANVAIYPSQVAVFVINNATQLSTSIYAGRDYEVDWISKTIILDSPIPSNSKLRIDVYETGNGNQLVKSNSQSNPIRTNNVTGFNEIYLDCAYSQPESIGSGVYKPASTDIFVIATATNSLSDSITCESIIDFTINSPIVFQGAVFGGLVAGQEYYVKGVNTLSMTITVSDTSINGVAGPIYSLSDGSGSMDILVEVGSGLVWTDPIVLHNGNRLDLGNTFRITQTSSGTDAITCNGTSTMMPGDPIVFSDTMFGETINPQTTYFVKAVISYNQFTISETNGGPVLALDDAFGGALAITHDYSFTLNENGHTADMLFAAQYDPATDYIAFTVFGETTPQYGYTLPETQLIIADGTSGPFNLANYDSGDNSTNAIVEVNGVRLSNGYTISSESDELTFTTAPTAGAVIAVTTYNMTERQYFNTQYNIPGAQVLTIENDWNQINVDRLWVTVNGYRVPSSAMSLDNNNQLTIEVPVTSSDMITITSMMPNATPNELTYMQTVNKLGEATVYRANSNTRTWLTSPLQNTDDTIYVEDITRITDQVVQNVTAPTAISGKTSIGLTSDKNTTVEITVYNATTDELIDPSAYSVEIVNLSPILQITSGVSTGDNLIVTSYVGNMLYVGGEQIMFSSIDVTANTVSGLQRGMNGTGEQAFISTYAEVYGFLPSNKLSQYEYNQTWNSNIYNPVQGDPLQISETEAATFLNTDIS